MKLYPDQNDPDAQTRLVNTPVDEQEVIAAIASASDDENPTAMKFVIAADLLLRLYLPAFSIAHQAHYRNGRVGDEAGIHRSVERPGDDGR